MDFKSIFASHASLEQSAYQPMTPRDVLAQDDVVVVHKNNLFEFFKDDCTTLVRSAFRGGRCAWHEKEEKADG